MKMSEVIDCIDEVCGSQLCEEVTGRVVAAFHSVHDAEEVIHKVNCHDELVGALKFMLYAIRHGGPDAGDMVDDAEAMASKILIRVEG